jgi:hypothetical protein
MIRVAAPVVIEAIVHAGCEAPSAAEPAMCCGKVLTRKATAESPARTAEMAPAEFAADASAATVSDPDTVSTSITESIPTTVCGGERNRVMGQPPGESGSRSQHDHGLT